MRKLIVSVALFTAVMVGGVNAADACGKSGSSSSSGGYSSKTPRHR